MALFKSGNPALNENVFKTITLTDASNAMTVRGTMNKLGLLLIFMMAGAFYTWSGFSKNSAASALSIQRFRAAPALG